MNLTHVLAFHRVASAGSFTLAARIGGVSQPTLSSQVRALEQQAGGPLLERGSRRIGLTPLGASLFEATQRLARAIDDVAGVLASRRMEAGGRLRVAADSAIHVLPILAELRQRTPDLAFSLRIDNSAAIVSDVLEQRADVGITARATSDGRLLSVKIRQDRLVLLVGARDTLARQRKASITVLTGRDLVAREQGSITREVADGELKRARVVPARVFDVATREAVAAGFGVGIVFASEAGGDPRLRTVAIADADVTVAEYAICRAERRNQRLVSRFFETARRVAQASGWLGDKAAGSHD